MAFNQTLSAILRGRWLIDKQWADEHIMMVLNIIKGQPVNVTTVNTVAQPRSFIGQSGYQGIREPLIVDPATMQRFASYVYDSNWNRVPNPNIPPNSVAIIQISGPITKYNGDCGEPGSIQLSQYIADMARRNNVGALVFPLDTPGGESRAAEGFVSEIKKCGKPTIGFIDDMAASLGVWYSSALDEVYFASSSGKIGSVGSYCTIFDITGYLEMNGVKLHEIYAPQSTDKNKPYKDALAGNYKLIEEDLKICVDKFISFVKTNRGDKAAASAKEWNSGKMFYAEEGIKLGLADGIRPFDQVVSKAAWLAKRKN